MTANTIRICYFGDSITYGRGHDGLGVDPDRTWTRLVDEALKARERAGTFVLTANMGVNGETTRNGLERLKDVYAFRPDVMTIQFGMNDCNCWLTDNGFPRVNPTSFRFNLKELIDKCAASGVRRAVVSTNHRIPVTRRLPTGEDYNASNAAYNRIIREVAAETGAALCDIESAFGDLSSDRRYFLDEDGRWVHLSEAGNALYASWILPFVEEALAALSA